jgi:hypothetical protein
MPGAGRDPPDPLQTCKSDRQFAVERFGRLDCIVNNAGAIGEGGPIAETSANAAPWLASSESSFVTGQALLVDGGLLSGRRWSQTRFTMMNLGSAFEKQLARPRSRLNGCFGLNRAENQSGTHPLSVRYWGHPGRVYSSALHCPQGRRIGRLMEARRLHLE